MPTARGGTPITTGPSERDADGRSPNPRERDAAGRPPTPRERDAAGRPLNARPRDGLGRPLPRGAEGGVPRTPEGLALPPLDSLAEAQRLLDTGRPFHAHEILEGTWKAAPTGERDLWQGLAQLAVGLTHLLRGNPVGAATVLRRGRDRVARYAGEDPYGVDVAGLVRWADALLADPGRDPATPALRHT
ncbi:MAG TPA: DUF309 domain-containing protein [Mycobacteriales bacterium]